MIENNILLSICVPTYNRALFLDLSLERMFSEITSDMPIEVIVSDNFSLDNSVEIASKYIDFPWFKLVKQERNVGPMLNGLELISKHANGKFCWIVGDDDYLVPGAIRNLIELIKLNNCDFIFLNLKGVNSNVDFNSFNLDLKPNFEIISSFEELLIPKYSQIFGGELMASVFKREFFLLNNDLYKKIEDEYLSTLETSYLHCVIFANNFIGKPAIYVKDIMVLADSRAREWSDKSAYLVVEQLFNLLMLYKKNGVSKVIMNKCYQHYIFISFISFLKFIFIPNLNYKERISFRRYIKFILMHPFSTFKGFYKIFYEKII